MAEQDPALAIQPIPCARRVSRLRPLSLLGPPPRRPPAPGSAISPSPASGPSASDSLNPARSPLPTLHLLSLATTHPTATRQAASRPPTSPKQLTPPHTSRRPRARSLRVVLAQRARQASSWIARRCVCARGSHGARPRCWVAPRCASPAPPRILPPAPAPLTTRPCPLLTSFRLTTTHPPTPDPQPITHLTLRPHARALSAGSTGAARTAGELVNRAALRLRAWIARRWACATGSRRAASLRVVRKALGLR